jgi:hypothetical protein
LFVIFRRGVFDLRRSLFKRGTHIHTHDESAAVSVWPEHNGGAFRGCSRPMEVIHRLTNAIIMSDEEAGWQNPGPAEPDRSSLEWSSSSKVDRNDRAAVEPPLAGPYFLFVRMPGSRSYLCEGFEEEIDANHGVLEIQRRFRNLNAFGV